MSLIKPLNHVQYKEFTSPPELDEELRKEVFILPASLYSYLPLIEKGVNQVNFIVMFGYFKLTNRFFEPNLYNQDDVEHVKKAYSIDVKDAYVSKNILAHYKKLIRTHFACKVADEQLIRVLEDETKLLIRQLSSTKTIFYALVEKAILLKYEVPSYTQLSRIITVVMSEHKNNIHDKLKKFSSHEVLKVLEQFLDEDKDYSGRYNLARLKRFSHSLATQNIKESLKHYKMFRDIHISLIPIVEAIELDYNTAGHYAAWVEKSDIHQIKRKAKHKQQFDLICFVVHQTLSRTDQLCDILMQTVKSNLDSVSREHTKLYYEQRQSRSAILINMSNLLQNTLIPKLHSIEGIFALEIDPTEKLEIIHKEISSIINNEQTKNFENMPNDYLGDKKSYYELLEKNSRSLQLKISEIIKVLDFDIKDSDKQLIKAIEYFKTTAAYTASRAPVNFISEEKEKNLTYTDNGNLVFRTALYKSFLFEAVENGIRSGSLNLKYSYRYRAFDDYMIKNDYYFEHKDELLKKHDIECLKNIGAIIDGLKGEVDNAFKDTNNSVLCGENKYFHLKSDGNYIVSTPKIEKDDEIDALSLYLPKEKFVPLIDILKYVNSATNFFKHFTHITHDKYSIPAKTNALSAAIIGYGCNISIPKMAKISKGVTTHDVDHIRTWYLTNESLVKANDSIIELTNNLDITKLFRKDPKRNHTASDGQKFNISVDSLNSGYSFKYFGLGRGVSRHTFIDESHRLFYTAVINTIEREAAYVIDGLMHHENIHSDIHSTDTFGFSEIVFALTDLLGFSFAPRIKNFKDQQLYSFESKKKYTQQAYVLLPVKYINTKLIEEQWDQIIRFVLTIKERHSSTSQLLKRLTSYSRQHKLYQALREYGRIIKTRFLLKYIDNVELRQQIEKQLNKVENANKFSKAIFFGNSGEYFYPTKEEQELASNCLRLNENAIICWNYLYFTDLLSKETNPEARNRIVKSIQNGSIVHWQHVNFYGEYDFTEKDDDGLYRFDIDEMKKFKLDESTD